MNVTIPAMQLRVFVGTLILLLWMLLCNPCSAEVNIVGRGLSVNVMGYGVIGDGVKDDTRSFQSALTRCSVEGSICIIPAGRKIRVTRPLFIWGNAGLSGEKGAEILPDFEDLTERYVINLGLSQKQKPEKPFSGVIEGIIFRPLSGPRDKWMPDRTTIAGRIIQFWRARGAVVRSNRFELGRYFYGATAGQNLQEWMASAAQGVRENISITNNIVMQEATSHGQEGIGMNYATGLDISDNYVYGSGDDLIGLHWCNDVKILRNKLYGVDSRIFVANGKNLLIDSNEVVRIKSPIDNKFKRGTALIYVGYEYPTAKLSPYSPRPSNITVTNNKLTLPDSAIDTDGVLSVRGADDVVIERNVIKNDSSKASAYGIWLSPWTPPEMGDSGQVQAKYPFGKAIVRSNKMVGKFPLSIAITGQCRGYTGNVYLSGNIASAVIVGCKKKVFRQ